jgi:glyoxylase-like metal-dependent hydrolase (beta-lactamase superfamily II)
MILEVFSSGPIDNNAILLACEKTKKAVLIDAPQDSTSRYIALVEKHHLNVQGLLLTHTHQDHIVDIAPLKEKFQMAVYVHPLDAANLQFPGADRLPIFMEREAIEPDEHLEDGELFQLGEITIKVVHTPGHSPGGVCFYIEKEDLLISGDTLFQGSMGRIDFPTSNPKDMVESLKKLAALPSDTRVIPGHGPETTIGAEMSWLKRRF